MERLEDTLRRLKQERDEADRRYNDALTELDRAHAPGFQVPRPARGFDDHQLNALNQSWQIIADGTPPPRSGSRRALRILSIARWRHTFSVSMPSIHCSSII